VYADVTVMRTRGDPRRKQSQANLLIVVNLLHDSIWCYALLRMRPPSISCAEGFVVIPCRKVDYDKSGWRVRFTPDVSTVYMYCSAARTNVVFTNSYVDNNSSLISE
jgi:hypothetical protein